MFLGSKCACWRICISDCSSVAAEGHSIPIVLYVYLWMQAICLLMSKALLLHPKEFHILFRKGYFVLCNMPILHGKLPFMKIKQAHGYLLINICSTFLQTQLFMILCRWWLFPNRCATLSFSRALRALLNRVIHFGVSVFSPLLAVWFCMAALVDRLLHTGRCMLQFSAPLFQKVGTGIAR